MLLNNVEHHTRWQSLYTEEQHAVCNHLSVHEPRVQPVRTVAPQCPTSNTFRRPPSQAPWYHGTVSSLSLPMCACAWLTGPWDCMFISCLLED